MRKLLIPAFVLPILFFLTMARNSGHRVNANQDQNKKKQAQIEFVNPKDLNASGSYTHVVTVN